MAEEIRTSPASESTPMSPPAEHIPTPTSPQNASGHGSPMSAHNSCDNPASPPVENTPMSPPHGDHTPMSPHGDHTPMSPQNDDQTPMSPPVEPTSSEPQNFNDAHTPSSPPAENNPMSPQNDDDSPTSPPATNATGSSPPPPEVKPPSPLAQVKPSSPDNYSQEEPQNLEDDSPTSPPANDTPSSPPYRLHAENPSSPEHRPRLINDNETPDTPPASPPSHPHQHQINDTPPSSPPSEDTPMSPQNDNDERSRPRSRSPTPSPKSPSPSSGSTDNLVIAQTDDAPDSGEPTPPISNMDAKTESEIVEVSKDVEMIDLEEAEHEEVKVKVKGDKKSSKKLENGVISEAKKDKEAKKAAKSTPEIIEEIDLEDLEDGEIEDDEDEDDDKAIEEMEIQKNKIEEELNRRDKKDKEKVSPFSKIFGGGDKENNKKESNKKEKDEKSSRSSSRKDKEKERDKESANHSSSSHKDKEKDKESSSKSRDKDKEKDKEKDRKKKRRHSETVDLLDEINESKHISRDKRSRKSQENNDLLDVPMVAEDDDDYLFVRGGSPPPSGLTNKQMVLQNFAYAGNDHDHDLDPGMDGYGRMYDEDLSDEETRRGPGGGGRRHRSPMNNRRRRDGRDDNGPRGGRRGGGGRGKEEMNKGPKSDVICAYYMQGKCQKTHEECVYSHNAVPPRKMELCKFWMMDCCAKREKCIYLHNDFPCKFYHTGLVCKQAERCKFSHKPLNEITKAVLLKHIETAPKEILGDFPRLNRNGALNLINKMESKILGALAEQERQKEKDQEPPRRTRWEQPTRDDQEKLQELMEEAGIGGYYRETLECQPPPVAPAPQIPQHHHQHQQPGLPSLIGGMQYIPPPTTASLIPQPSPVLVHNAALASVLANLNIPSSTIQPIVQQQQPQQQQNTNTLEDTKTVVPQPQISPAVVPPSVIVQPKQEPEVPVTETPYWNANIANATNTPAKVESSNILHDPPEHLPPMQKELFLRIQQQQLKHENKSANPESDEDERPDDDGWYSSDEDERENRGKSSGFRDKSQGQGQNRNHSQTQPNIDLSSVISSIRSTVESSPSANTNKMRKSPSPPPSGRGDVDLRTTTTNTPSSGGQSQPFGDTDFRVPPTTHRPDLRDIDLRLTSSPPGPSPVPSVPSTASENTRLSTNPLAFLKLPSGPATEIDASINSHPPVQYKLKIVLGVDQPDYRYIRHTMTPSQLLMDPRLGPRPGSGTLSLIPDPASPPSSSHAPVSSHHSPATIPAGDSVIMDPRVRRGPTAHGGQQQPQQQPQIPQMPQMPQMPLPPSQMPGLLGDPRNPRDPRSIQIGVPGGWPSAEDLNMSQAALAAQFMNMNAHPQLGIPPLFPTFPNAPGFPNPFMQPDFSGLNQGGHGQGQGMMGHHSRQQFQNNHGHGRGRPVSSWERYSQQQSDQDGSNIGTARGMSPSI